MITVDQAVTIEIGKLQLLPGDILVIKFPEEWTSNHISMFKEYLATLGIIPDAKVLVLPAGTDIGVVHPIPGFH